MTEKERKQRQKLLDDPIQKLDFARIIREAGQAQLAVYQLFYAHGPSVLAFFYASAEIAGALIFPFLFLTVASAVLVSITNSLLKKFQRT